MYRSIENRPQHRRAPALIQKRNDTMCKRLGIRPNARFLCFGIVAVPSHNAIESAPRTSPQIRHPSCTLAVGPKESRGYFDQIDRFSGRTAGQSMHTSCSPSHPLLTLMHTSFTGRSLGAPSKPSRHVYVTVRRLRSRLHITHSAHPLGILPSRRKSRNEHG